MSIVAAATIILLAALHESRQDVTLESDYVLPHSFLAAIETDASASSSASSTERSTNPLAAQAAREKAEEDNMFAEEAAEHRARAEKIVDEMHNLEPDLWKSDIPVYGSFDYNVPRTEDVNPAGWYDPYDWPLD